MKTPLDQKQANFLEPFEPSYTGTFKSFPKVHRRNNRKDETITQKVCVCLSVGVDGDMKRFMVHTTLLRHTEFLELLHKSAEEYGFCNDSILRIPYKALDFEEYWMIKRSKARIYKVEPV
ncbi:hypothetical protein ACFX2I_046425 [Malus domestica]